jgi:hypothetical protein
MVGQEIKKYEACLEYVEELDLKLLVHSDKLQVGHNKGELLGVFDCVGELYNYLLGYDRGRQEGLWRR